ncbi:MAG: hypothetical protein Q4615_13120 [Paracoccus aminovorans]|nr:hypothetical protein [Paracoccus aminovorans]
MLFPLLMALMLPKWLATGGSLPEAERQVCRKLIRLAIRDAWRGDFSRSHAEVTRIAEGG